MQRLGIVTPVVGPRTVARAKLTNADCAKVTILSRSTVRGPMPSALGSVSLRLGVRYWAKAVIHSNCREGLLRALVTFFLGRRECLVPGFYQV